MTGWQETTLGHVISLQRGHDLPERERKLGIVPVIGSAGPNGWHDKARAPGHGVTVGRSGASAGVVTYVHDAYWPHNTVLYVTDFKGNDPRFVAYLLQTLPLAEMNSGAAQPSLNRNFLYPMPVRVPSPDIQRRISFILGAYDHMIEVNQRRIALLEEMARRLFEEWFVHYRAPNCDGLPLVETAIGKVPHNWNVVRLDEIYKTSAGGTPSRSSPHYYGGGIAWVKTKELLDGPIWETEESITKEGLANSSAKLFPPYTVLVAMYGANIGQLGVLLREAATNQACCAILSTSGWAYPYLTLLHDRDRLVALRAGAAQQNISQHLIRGFKVLLPPAAQLETFEQQAQPMLSCSFILHRQNGVLAVQRDMLLRPLISGELAVSVVERELEAVA